MLDIEHNSVMEVSTLISEAGSSLTNKIHYESYSEFRHAHRDLGDLLHDDRCASQFKTSKLSANASSEKHLCDASIGIAVTEALIDVSDAEDNLDAENNPINELFE